LIAGSLIDGIQDLIARVKSGAANCPAATT